jgi:hypothetical protein
VPVGVTLDELVAEPRRAASPHASRRASTGGTVAQRLASERRQRTRPRQTDEATQEEEKSVAVAR